MLCRFSGSASFVDQSSSAATKNGRRLSAQQAQRGSSNGHRDARSASVAAVASKDQQPQAQRSRNGSTRKQTAASEALAKAARPVQQKGNGAVGTAKQDKNAKQRTITAGKAGKGHDRGARAKVDLAAAAAAVAADAAAEAQQAAQEAHLQAVKQRGRRRSQAAKAAALQAREQSVELLSDGDDSEASGSDGDDREASGSDDNDQQDSSVALATEERSPNGAGPQGNSGSTWVRRLAAAIGLLAAGRLLLRIASIMLRPIQQLWWALPFRLRLLLRGGRLPPPPQVHASPRVAAMLTGDVIDSSKSRRKALFRGGFDKKGRCRQLPLSDVPRWRFEALLGIPVKDVSLYRQALTAASALPPDEAVTGSYQRLEFLGDAVLALAVRTHLMQRYPQSTEGSLTIVQHALVDSRALLRMAVYLKLERYIVANAYSMLSEGHHGATMRGDAMEALLGAAYLDHGWQMASNLTFRLIEEALDGFAPATYNSNFKGQLFEQAKQQALARPRFVSKRSNEGWSAVVHMDGVIVGKGEAQTRRDAHQTAARVALEQVAPDSLGQRIMSSMSDA